MLALLRYLFTLFVPRVRAVQLTQLALAAEAVVPERFLAGFERLLAFSVAPSDFFALMNVPDRVSHENVAVEGAVSIA